MAPDEVIPHVGIRLPGGEILRLGMSHEEVERLGDPDIQVDYRGNPPVVAFLQSPKHWGTFAGVELFESGADDVIAEIVRVRNLDPDEFPPGRHEYHFADLRMRLWRSCVSELDDEQGFIFDCVSLYSPGYYRT